MPRRSFTKELRELHGPDVQVDVVVQTPAPPRRRSILVTAFLFLVVAAMGLFLLALLGAGTFFVWSISDAFLPRWAAICVTAVCFLTFIGAMIAAHVEGRLPRL